MSIELLRGELERLYSLEEMMELASRLIGVEPDEVGGTASPASFARSLTEHCQQKDAVAALVDAIVGTRKDASPRLQKLVDDLLRAPLELKTGDTFGQFTILRKLGAGPNGSVYAAKRDEQSVVVKVLHTAAVHDRSSVQRYLTRNRLLSHGDCAHLPSGLLASSAAGRPFIAYEYFDARPLSTRVGRTGALHINEARPLLHGALVALKSLHDRKLVHGAVKLENVLISKRDDGTAHVVLVDAGGDLLTSAWVHSDIATTGGNRIKGMSPEQLKGLGTTSRSDMYAFGAMLFEALTGKPPYDEQSASDLVVAHLSKQPPRAADAAPRGWVSEELSNLCARLLDKDPARRPDAEAVLAFLGPAEKEKEPISESDLADAIDALVADPSDGEAAILVELTLERAADPRRVAEAFLMAADTLDIAASASSAMGAETGAVAEMRAEAARDRADQVKRTLFFRSARVFETKLKDFARAEEVYRRLLALDRTNDVAQTGLENALKAQDKLDELVEELLARSAANESHSERARALNKIGHLYAGPLEDLDQAVFAFAQALAQDVQNEGFAEDLARTAGTNMQLWAEAMRSLHEVSQHPRMPEEVRVSLFLRLGNWYAEKISRPDLAVPCFETVLAIDPAHEGALEGMTGVYRKAQQWRELVAVLLTRVDRALMPERARDLRAEAATILDLRLNDLGSARELHEKTLAEDPGHLQTVEALARIYQRNEDWAGYAKILERQAAALVGAQRAESFYRIGELYEDQLRDLPEAQKRFEAALELDATNLNALRGLDRVFNRTGRYQDLLLNLEKQRALAATPRQKIQLFLRSAGIYEEEFLDHAKAAECLEQVLAADAVHEGAIASLMRHYRALARWDDVAELFDRSLRVATEPERRIALLLAQGRVLLDQIGSPARARLAYEAVLELDPKHASALDSLANVRAATGDALAALAAVESLAEKAETPSAKADQWLRAGRILATHGDRDGAIQRFKLALEALPTHAAAGDALRDAYLARGDAGSAVELLKTEIDRTDGALAKARLCHDLAVLLRDRAADFEAAREAADRAVTLDPTHVGALLLLGDLAFDRGAFLEAATHYGALTSRIHALPADDGKRMLMRFIDSLAHTGSTETAMSTVTILLELAPDDPAALARAARVHLDSGDAAGAVAKYVQLFERFGDALSAEARGDDLVRYGRALAKTGRAAEAIQPLTDAADLMPGSLEPLEALVQVYEAEGQWEEVVRIRQRRLDIAEGEERATLLLEISEVFATRLMDATRAGKTLVAALEERPDDRRVLTRLMKLYSKEKDWSKLLDVVLKLAEGVDDKLQKAKYIHTAASVAARQMSDFARADEYLTLVIEFDPNNDRAYLDQIAVREQKGDFEGMAALSVTTIERAARAGDTGTTVSLLDQLARTYHERLGRPEDGVAALEKAQALDPDNTARAEKLYDLYSADVEKYLEKAVAHQSAEIGRDPFNAQGYRKLRKLFTQAKEPDPAWCVCQALHVMSCAEPDEERFFRRMRAENAAEARERVSPEDWANTLTHELVDPLITDIFRMIEPAVLARNARPLEQLGFPLQYAIDLAMHPYPMSQTMFYAAGVLGMTPPPTFLNPQDPGGISFLHGQPPAVVLGQAALATELPTQAAAFIAARHLTYYRPGVYVRHLVPTGTGLRAWLFGAIRLIHEGFPVAAELESTVRENVAAIRSMLDGPTREQLGSVVSKLLQGGSIDLKRWVASADLTADRAGLLVCHDLEIACEMIKASDDATAALPQKDRIRELTLFTVSPKYFAIRKRLGISVDS
ncbi:MAG: hypothetical protein EXR75_06500 [Myxococcales bacterium]|nr:hypothetical protein [Myxococcales bacterium]